MHTNLLAICFYPEKPRKVVLIYLDVFCAHVGLKKKKKKNPINILVRMLRPCDTFTFSHHLVFALQTVFGSTFPLQVEHISTI